NALLFPIFGAGLILGCQALDQGGTLELSHLFLGFKRRTGDLVLVGVFNLIGWVVIALAVIAVIGGGVFMALLRGGMPGASLSILSMLIAMLLVAGLSVPLYMATWFAPALIVLHDLAPAAALKASFYACLKNWLPFLVYGVVLLVLGLAAAIPLGLGYLVLVPVLVASVYTSYRDIFCAVQ
ncbi:MAG: BPSS1780 family membrane protein, partial [Betaproteobacteria bacterium]|nr:BPSS1780 family membrane protein [Betaproteobacteria bacterium]